MRVFTLRAAGILTQAICVLFLLSDSASSSVRRDRVALYSEPRAGSPHSIAIYIGTKFELDLLLERPAGVIVDSPLVREFYTAATQAPVVKYKWFGNSSKRRWYVVFDVRNIPILKLYENDFSAPFITLRPYSVKSKSREGALLPGGSGIHLPLELMEKISRVAGLPKLSP